MSIELLKNVKLFQNLNERQLNLIKALMIEEKIPKDKEIIKEGGIGKFLYIIKEGKVKIFKKFGKDNFLLTELKENDFFGELSLIDEEVTSATVVAAEDSVLLKMNADDFKAIIKVETDLSSKLWEALAKTLSERIRKTSDIVRNYYGLSKALCENEEFRLLFATWNFYNTGTRETIKPSEKDKN